MKNATHVLYCHFRIFTPAECEYELIIGHIGCGGGGGNIGRPKSLLKDVTSECKTGGPECVELGKKACDATSNCWGFGIHNVQKSWGVQVYDSSALNPTKCDGKYGLEKKPNWNRNVILMGSLALDQWLFLFAFYFLFYCKHQIEEK